MGAPGRKAFRGREKKGEGNKSNTYFTRTETAGKIGRHRARCLLDRGVCSEGKRGTFVLLGRRNSTETVIPAVCGEGIAGKKTVCTGTWYGTSQEAKISVSHEVTNLRHGLKPYDVVWYFITGQQQHHIAAVYGVDSRSRKKPTESSSIVRRFWRNGS